MGEIEKSQITTRENEVQRKNDNKITTTQSVTQMEAKEMNRHCSIMTTIQVKMSGTQFQGESSFLHDFASAKKTHRLHITSLVLKFCKV